MSDNTIISAGERITSVADADTNDFLELVRLSGLDPANDFRHMDLRGFDFSNCDLSGFDFTGSVLDGANFDGAIIDQSIFDRDFLPAISFSDVSRIEVELLRACAEGNMKIARKCLDDGANPNCEVNGSSPLIEASGKNNLLIIDLLVSRGARVDSSTLDRGWTAMLEAASKGQANATSQLINSGADVNLSSGGAFSTPLIEAARNGRLELVELLLAQGAELNLKDKDSLTPILAASINGHTTVVKHLIDRGASLKTKGKGKKTLLALSVESGNLDLVRLVYDCAGTSNKDGKVGTKVFASAIEAGNISVLRYLLARGIVVDFERAISSSEINSAICSVCQNGNLPALQLLIERGFPINSEALECAARGNQVEILRALLKSVENSKQHHRICGNLREAVYAAAVSGNVDAVRVLLSYRNCIDYIVKFKREMTLMMHICCQAPVEIIRTIINEFDVSINKADRDGETALDYAMRARNFEIIPLLREAKALTGVELSAQ